MSRVPGYWMNETTGALRPAIEAYLSKQPLSDGQIAAIRAYLRQWIAADWVNTARVQLLRARIDGVTTVGAITEWLDLAAAEDIDPL